MGRPTGAHCLSVAPSRCGRWPAGARTPAPSDLFCQARCSGASHCGKAVSHRQTCSTGRGSPAGQGRWAGRFWVGRCVGPHHPVLQGGQHSPHVGPSHLGLGRDPASALDSPGPLGVLQSPPCNVRLPRAAACRQARPGPDTWTTKDPAQLCLLHKGENDGATSPGGPQKSSLEWDLALWKESCLMCLWCFLKLRLGR